MRWVVPSGYLKGGGTIPDKTMVTTVAQKPRLCRFERDKAGCPGYLAHGLQMTCEESQGVTIGSNESDGPQPVCFKHQAFQKVYTSNFMASWWILASFRGHADHSIQIQSVQDNKKIQILYLSYIYISFSFKQMIVTKQEYIKLFVYYDFYTSNPINVKWISAYE